MLILTSLLLVVVVIAVAAVVVGQMGLLQGRPPSNPGVRDGRLKPPSKTPNSVSSQARLHLDHPMREHAQIDPLALRDGDGPGTLSKLKAVVQEMPGAKVVRSQPDYLYVQFTTRWMKYVDDAEFWFDPVAQVIQLRSSSRVGGKDYGVNRRRIEAIRARLAAR